MKYHLEWAAAREHILAMLDEQGMLPPACPECRRPMELVIALIMRPVRREVKPTPAWHCRQCWK